jgi:hypothetical protein
LVTNKNLMTQGTSITAWHEKLKSISADERAVLQEIRKEPGTINEIAKRLGWEAGRVSARINGLQEPRPGEEEKRKLGLITEAGKCPDRLTKRMAIVWKEKSPLPDAFAKPTPPAFKEVEKPIQTNSLVS